MSDYQLVPGLYLAPTPGGAFYAVARPLVERTQHIVLNLLREDRSPVLNERNLEALTGLQGNAALEQLYRLQSMHLVQGLREPRQLPGAALENVLPELLAELAGPNKALLADGQGFYLASHGFHHETAEELAGLSAQLGQVGERYQGLLRGNLGLGTSAWALVNSGGNSDLGFWPLHVGPQRLVLVVAGQPRLNRPALIDLVWLLVRRLAAHGRAT
jgi:hypothetical protein